MLHNKFTRCPVVYSCCLQRVFEGELRKIWLPCVIGTRGSTKEKEGSKARVERNEADSQKGEKQTKLDTVVTQISKESSVYDLIASMNSFHTKINKLASKDYIEKSVTEEFVTSQLDTIKRDITKDSYWKFNNSLLKDF